jgi:hypothetical protein
MKLPFPSLDWFRSLRDETRTMIGVVLGVIVGPHIGFVSAQLVIAELEAFFKSNGVSMTLDSRLNVLVPIMIVSTLATVTATAIACHQAREGTNRSY